LFLSHPNIQYEKKNISITLQYKTHHIFYITSSHHHSASLLYSLQVKTSARVRVQTNSKLFNFIRDKIQKLIKKFNSYISEDIHIDRTLNALG
jgi:hypothetical protein